MLTKNVSGHRFLRACLWLGYSYWEDLVRSGLDCLIVAIDGISEDVYKNTGETAI